MTEPARPIPDRFRRPRPQRRGRTSRPAKISPTRFGGERLDGRRLRGPAPRRSRTSRAGPPHRRRLPRPVVRPAHHDHLRRHLLHGARLAAPPRRPRNARRRTAAQAGGRRVPDRPLVDERGAGLAEAARLCGLSLPTAAPPLARRPAPRRLPRLTAATSGSRAQPSTQIAERKGADPGCRSGTWPTPCGSCAASSPSPGPTASSRPASIPPKASKRPRPTRPTAAGPTADQPAPAAHPARVRPDRLPSPPGAPARLLAAADHGPAHLRGLRHPRRRRGRPRRARHARRPGPRRAHLQRPRRPRRRSSPSPAQADHQDRGGLPSARRADQDDGAAPRRDRGVPHRPRHRRGRPDRPARARHP